MAYDADLADRIGALLDDCSRVVEKKMFGGLAFIINGNLALAASRQGGLMVRCDPSDSDDHIDAGAHPMIMRGRPMTGWLYVEPDELANTENLRRWVSIGATYAASLRRK
jgi:hypothetical protein